MKTQPNLQGPTLSENGTFSNFKNTMKLVSNVLKLTKKVFML
ncbi:hypothetical protein WPG_1408 [Winogradskyella sp. PG-2]|nr:hypothetical protein WPG_1408 [Winogradskyella sp. PG-2]